MGRILQSGGVVAPLGGRVSCEGSLKGQRYLGRTELPVGAIVESKNLELQGSNAGND